MVGKPGVRVNIYFTQSTFEALKAFIISKHGEKKALSITVEQAVKEYLEHERLRQQLTR